jgi:hypothetical protein
VSQRLCASSPAAQGAAGNIMLYAIIHIIVIICNSARVYNALRVTPFEMIVTLMDSMPWLVGQWQTV